MVLNDISKYKRKNELFSCNIKFKKTLDETLLIKYFILIDKFYPDYQIYKDTPNEKISDWRPWVLNNSFNFHINNVLHFNIAPLFYLQKSGEIQKFYFKDGITCFFAWDEKNNCYDFGLSLYVDLVTDVVYLLNEKRNYYKENQADAAKINRNTFSHFIKATEKFLNGEVIEFITDHHLTEDSNYKYGIKENAKLIVPYD